MVRYMRRIRPCAEGKVMIGLLVAAVAVALIAALALAGLAEPTPEEYVYENHTVIVHGAGLGESNHKQGRI